MKVLGYKDVDYTKKDGTEVHGITLYLEDALFGENAGGIRTVERFVSQTTLENSGFNRSHLHQIGIDICCDLVESFGKIKVREIWLKPYVPDIDENGYAIFDK